MPSCEEPKHSERKNFCSPFRWPTISCFPQGGSGNLTGLAVNQVRVEKGGAHWLLLCARLHAMHGDLGSVILD